MDYSALFESFVNKERSNFYNKDELCFFWFIFDYFY